jgi:predicted transcriptional regulator
VTNRDEPSLSRRERQIMDILYRLGEGSTADVVRQMPDDPSYNTVRVTLGILERKGHVEHREDGKRYVYYPTVARDKASRKALKHLVKTFYGGSVSNAVLALLDMDSRKLSNRELDEIAASIKRGKGGR